MNRENRIRALREEKKISGTIVAKKLGISPQYYYDIEKGKRKLSAEIAEKLSDILQTTTDYLLGKTDVNLYDYVPYDENKKITPTIKEQEFIADIELSNVDNLYKIPMSLDGKRLTKEEAKIVIALLRSHRQIGE